MVCSCVAGGDAGAPKWGIGGVSYDSPLNFGDLNASNGVYTKPVRFQDFKPAKHLRVNAYRTASLNQRFRVHHFIGV